MLAKYKFESDNLRKAIEECKSGDRPVRLSGSGHVALPKEEADPEDVTLDELGSSDPAKKRRLDPDAERIAIEKYISTVDCISLLPLGTHGKRVPYRCSLCTSPMWPNGKVGEADRFRLDSVKHFVTRHLSSNQHIQALKKEEVMAEKKATVTCNGLSIADPMSGNFLYAYRDEVAIWGSMCNFEEHAKHVYTRNASQGTWTIQAHNCEKEVEQEDELETPACPTCKKLGERTGVIRNVLRFMIKYWAASNLNCRLFHGQAALDELMAKIKSTNMYKGYEKKIEATLKLSTHHMQQFVRASFLCDPHMTNTLKDFVATVVKPCLQINISSVPDHLAEISSKLSSILAGGEASDEDLVQIKLAAGCISGKLSGHPLIQGLTLQLQRKLEKEGRGIHCMNGRRSAESDLERSLIRDAGLQLAVAAGNNALARRFGLAKDSHRISFDVLTENSLPIPALAICWPEVLQQNFLLIDQRYVRAQLAPKRVLVFTFYFGSSTK